MTPAQQTALTTLLQRQQRAILSLNTRILKGIAVKGSMQALQARHRTEVVDLVLGITNAPAATH